MTPHVHFEAQLAVPPADRPRRGVRYPNVAQKKDVPDRGMYEDLNWRKYAVSESDVRGDRDPIKLSTETKETKESTINRRSTTNLGNSSSVKGLLMVACETLIEMTMSQHRHSPRKLARPRLYLLPWSEEHHMSDNSSYQSACESTSSSSSSSSTTPSADNEPTVRPWD